MLNTNRVGKGFDRITGVYDTVACICSFNRINKSQLAFLSQLSVQKTCLILGGGTGYFLQKVLEQNKAVHVTYADASAKMIACAKERIQNNIPQGLNRVTFICTNVEELDWEMYDVLVCNYFLDLFENDYVNTLINTFRQKLNKEGILYVTDFRIPEKNGLLKWSTQNGLKMLYTLFRWTTHMHTRQLPEIEKILKEQGFCIVCSKDYLKGILRCSIYN